MRLPRIFWRLGLYLAVFGLALLSNYFFTGEWLTRFNEVFNERWSWRQTLATGLLAAAIAGSAWCFGRKDDYAVKTVESGREGKPRGWLRLLPAGILYATATVMYLSAGETAAVRWLWLAGVVALLIPFFKGGRIREFWTFEFWEYSLLALIVAGAFALRYVDLTNIPQHMHHDVAIMGEKTRTMLQANDSRWIGMSVATEHPFSEHQLLMVGMRLFGVSYYGIAMLSVIAGTASVAAMHYLGRILFNRWVGLLAAGFLAIDYVHIHFSRIIFGPVTTLLLLTGAVFLAHGIKRGSRLGFALGGVGFGLALMGYYSGRVGVVILACLVVVWLWQRRNYTHITAGCWGLVLAGVVFTFGPNLAYGVKNFTQFNGRGNSVILWTPKAWTQATELYNAKEKPVEVIKQQTRRALLTPFYFHDSGTLCGMPRPMLPALAAVFFMLGLGFFARRFRKLEHVLPLAWVGLTFLLGGVLTVDPPFWPHLNIALPAMALIAAVGAERFARRVILAGGRRMQVLIPITVASGLVFSGINNWEVYYEFQGDYGNGRSRAMRQIELITRGVDYRVYIISRDIRWNHEVHRFFLRGVDGQDLSEAALYEKTPAITKPTAFVVHQDTDYKKCVDYLTQAYPWAVRRAFNPTGWKYTIIRVFPPGYVEPPKEMDPPPLRWDRPGWDYVFAALLGGLSLGWWTLHRELRRKRGWR